MNKHKKYREKGELRGGNKQNCTIWGEEIDFKIYNKHPQDNVS